MGKNLINMMFRYDHMTDSYFHSKKIQKTRFLLKHPKNPKYCILTRI